jgi:hypothetical protein
VSERLAANLSWKAPWAGGGHGSWILKQPSPLSAEHLLQLPAYSHEALFILLIKLPCRISILRSAQGH